VVTGFLGTNGAGKSTAIEVRDVLLGNIEAVAQDRLVGHSVMDGVAIGAGFQAGSTVGAVVAIAVLSHDFADGFNTYTITSLYGNDRRRALTLLITDTLAPVTGAAITLMLTIPQQILGFLAGVLLHLASSDILPVDVRNGQAQPRRREAHGHP
jgi:zinc and cadmium transporter